MPFKFSELTVMFAAFICILLIFSARHPNGKRKIKEIWHGRIFWEGESNTTMLRAAVVKNTSRNDVDMANLPYIPTKDIVKSVVAICAATRSKSDWRSLDDTTLQNVLIPSIQKTISLTDRSKYDVRLYLAADHDDQFWLNNKNSVKTPDWLSVHVGFYEVPEHKIPFNPMMRAAYNDGAEYMVRINDDSEFITSDWVSKAIAKLESYEPPNLGMVGPNCLEGNTAIMTHDMVHRTHLDIFEYYYPDVFSAWWIDDWISKVYGPKRSTKMMDWTVKHHTHKHGTRYEVQHHEAQFLKGELEKGGAKIGEWLKANTITQKEPVTTCWQAYQDTIDSTISVAFVPGKSVMMESTSVKLLCDFMSADKDVLEWGSGGSTNFFSQFVKHWDTVEHDAVWASKIKQQALKGVDYHSVPINWKASTPRDGNYDEFKKYVEFPKTLNKQWDVILIDGRARVACAESVLRNHLLKKDGIVVVHDWERDHAFGHAHKDFALNYKNLLKYYDVVTEDISGPRHLGILKPKNKVVDFIIAGAMKSGTTFLANNILFHHPKIQIHRSEIHFFDDMCGGKLNNCILKKYEEMLPHRKFDNQLVGDKSPRYIYIDWVPEKIKQLQPHAKIIFCLRNPIYRAYSHYKHNVRAGRIQKKTFEDVIKEELLKYPIENAKQSPYPHLHEYVRRGIYINQLKRFFDLFPREQLLVIDSEKMWKESNYTYIENFLGLSQPLINGRGRGWANKSPNFPAIKKETLLFLEKKFAPYNKKLCNFLKSYDIECPQWTRAPIMTTNNFQIHVLTMNRATSLQRLLVSLENSEYGGENVDLYVHIDKSDDNHGCIKTAKLFDFSHGHVAIEVAEQNSGLRDSWFNAWYPLEKARAVIFEDDMEVSPLWFKWLSKAWDTYSDRKDLAGISLQIQTLKAKNPHHNNWNPGSKGPFLYRVPGSWGFSPHPIQWKSFLDWIRTQDLNTLDVSTPGLITSDWWQQLDHRGMWTQYYIFFCVQHDLFTLYANLPERKTLTAHWREKGVHTPTSEGPDFPLASTITLEFPSEPNKYDWNGKRIKTNIKTALQLNDLKNIDEFGDESPNISLESMVNKLQLKGHIDTKFITINLGARDGIGTGGNTDPTWPLYKNMGADGIAVEGSSTFFPILRKNFQGLRAKAVHAFIYSNNVNSILTRNNIKTIDVFKIDIDSFDCDVILSVLENYSPSVIFSEYNIKFPPPIKLKLTTPEKIFNSEKRNHIYECSLQYQVEMLLKQGYTLVQIDWQNAIYIKREIADKLNLKPLNLKQEYDNTYRSRPNRQKYFWWNKDIDHLLYIKDDETLLKATKNWIKLGKHDQDGSVIVGIDDMELMRYKKQASSVKLKPTLVIGGMSKDNEQYQKNTLKTILRMRNIFDVKAIIVYENDSKDNTLAGLQQWQHDLKDIQVDIISETGVTGNRFQIFADGRQKILNKLMEKYSPDYYLLLDMDGLNKDLENVQSCFQLPTNWGGCCANQRDVYYDLWVLRTFDSWVDCDVWWDNKCALTRDEKFKYIPPSTTPIRVKSCFGGAALYNMKQLSPLVQKGAHYSATPACHIGFHTSLHALDNNFGLYIQPKMLNTALEHIPVNILKREKEKKANFNTVIQTSTKCPNGYRYHKNPTNSKYVGVPLTPWNWDTITHNYDKLCEKQSRVGSHADSTQLMSLFTNIVKKTCEHCTSFLAIEVGTMFGMGTTKHLYQSISNRYTQFQLWTYEGISERFCFARNHLKDFENLFIVNELVTNEKMLTCMILPETGSVLSSPDGPTYSEIYKKTPLNIEKGLMGGWFKTHPVGRTADLVVIDSTRFTHTAIVEALNSVNGLISSDTVFLVENDYWENTDEIAILRKYFDLENIETFNPDGEMWPWVTFTLK